jgi:hypothetical protein
MSIALVGLIGVFSTYATAIPYERGLREEAVLDRALATAGRPDQQASLESLRPELADQANEVIAGSRPLPDRVAVARAELLTRVETSAAALGARMRLFIAVFTIMAAALGTLLLRMVSKPAPSAPFSSSPSAPPQHP